MQLHNALSLIAVALVGTVAAQPTLDEGNNAPVAGDLFALTSYTTNVPASFYGSGSAGADQLYGFWMLPNTGNRDIQFLDPAVTATTASFPGATVLATNGGQDTLYWNVSADGLEQVGIRGSVEGIAPFTDGALELKYPCTYGTTWTDAFSANYTVSGFPVTRVGSITGVADGYGTIQLPAIELTDILRVKVRKVQQDNSALGLVYRSYETYYFFQEGIRYPVMKTSQDTVIFGAGTPAVTWNADWLYGTGEVGMEDLAASEIVFTPYPNPTNGQLDLRMEGGDLRAVEVLNTTGQLMIQKTQRQGGTISGLLDLSGLASGVYQVRVTQADGRQGTRRIVVQ